MILKHKMNYEHLSITWTILRLILITKAELRRVHPLCYSSEACFHWSRGQNVSSENVCLLCPSSTGNPPFAPAGMTAGLHR